MYRRFEIERFRGLVSLKLEDLGRINVLTGLNDAGKTSTLEALYLHASGPLAPVIAVQTLRATRQQQELALGAETDNPWQGLFHNFDLSAGPTLSGSTSLATYVLRFVDAGKSSEQAFGAPSAGTDNTQAGMIKQITVIEQRNKQREKSFTQTMSVSTNFSAAGPTGISLQFKLEPPADGPFMRAGFLRPNSLPDLAVGYSELRRRNTDADLLEALREVDERIERLEVLVDNGRAQLHADLGGPLVPFQLLGDGTSAIAQYLIAMQASRDGILLIDEIGSGIHYQVLPAMWRAVSRAAKRLNVQLFVTTHSREALQAAATLTSGSADELAVYRLKRAEREAPTSVGQFTGTRLKAALEINTELR